MPTPDVLGRNGTYVVFRKLHTRVAAYRQIPAREGREPRGGGAARREDGRTLAERRAAVALSRAGRPRARRRPAAQQRLPLRRRSARLQVPGGRARTTANPRDALDDDGSVNVRLHRMIRRGTSYGPMLPEGVLEDDGADRGIIFVFAGAHLEAPVRVRQDPMAERRHLHRRARARRTRSSGRTTAPAASRFRSSRSAAGCRTAAVRRHPRRRVLLRPGPASAALAGGAGHLTGPTRERTTWHDPDGHRPLEGTRLRPPSGRRRGTR